LGELAEPTARSSARLGHFYFPDLGKRCQALMAKAAGVARDEARFSGIMIDCAAKHLPTGRFPSQLTLISVPFVCLRPGLEEEPGLRSPRQ